MLSTLAKRPSLFIDYFQADAGVNLQRTSDRFKNSVESFKSNLWSKCIKLRKTVFISKKSDDPQAILLHSLFNVDVEKDDGALKEQNIALSGFYNRIGVWKEVPKTDMFKTVEQSTRGIVFLISSTL